MSERGLRIGLAVENVERSLAFYDSVLGPLGLKEKFRNLTYRRTEEVVYLEYGVQGFGLRPADGGVHRHYEVGIEHLAFEVDDIEQFAKHSAAKGYPLSDGPHKNSGGGAIAFVDAPEGYEIELIERAKKS